MSDSEIIALSICSEIFIIDSEKAWYPFVKWNYRHLFLNLCCRTRLNRTRRNLLQITELLATKAAVGISHTCKPILCDRQFPLPVCKLGRARFCPSFCTDGAKYGKCSFKKETYYGFKVHALITLEGYITTFEITPASVDDRERLRDFAENHLHLVILKDKGYTRERLLEDMHSKGICPMSLKPSSYKMN